MRRCRCPNRPEAEPRGLAGAVAPQAQYIHLNTYINIYIYSIKNINFTYFLLKYDDFG
jgi:hypothetical protein